MTDLTTVPPAPSALQPIVAGIFRHALTVVGTGLVAHGLATKGEASAVLQLADYLAGSMLVAIPVAWSGLRAWVSHTRWAQAWARLEGNAG